jgi:hypothetical protein
VKRLKQTLWTGVLTFALSSCDNSDTYVAGSENANSSPSKNDLEQGNQLANTAAGGQSGSGLDQTWRGYQSTDPASFQAALPAYMQPYAQDYIDAGQNTTLIRRCWPQLLRKNQE